MPHPLGQQFVVIDGASVHNCDVCTSYIDSKHIATFVAGQGQAFICWETAEAIAKIVNGDHMAKARAARGNREEVAV